MFIITFGEMLTMIFIEFYKKSLPFWHTLFSDTTFVIRKNS